MTNSNSKQKYTTVGELIEILKRHDLDRIVVVQVNGERTVSHPLFLSSNGSFRFGGNTSSCVRLFINDGEDQ